MEKGRIELEDPTFRKAVDASLLALRSYQYGNGSPDLAEQTADYLEQSLQTVKRFEENKPPLPIDMILPCPSCGTLHVDAPEPMICQTCGLYGENECICEVMNLWLNPPHKSHLCHGCGIVWRPADVPTNGVAVIKTRGENDIWFPKSIDPKTVAIPNGFARRGPEETIRTNDLYFDGTKYSEVPKVREYCGKVGNRTTPIIYRVSLGSAAAAAASSLGGEPLIEYLAGGKVRLTNVGRNFADGSGFTASSNEDLLTAWCTQLKSGPQSNILRRVFAIYPSHISRGDLADNVGVSETSSSFANNLSRLRTLGLLDYGPNKTVFATELLFPFN